ncbi:hypothetical protein BST27_05825 [Mycobacterium intermedium]|uniref:Uncharacterized protein n=1 Tax=Mycobacterium intermedium TaxID=28445 RepID=A0A1E3S6N3_MYCIE|nr:hypothetical protein [Mycobacterium intermedium]MCV6967947.1 hypothetical protein [Mycobacterium intermedium]ODQ97721.1 hypothetical protein BHQ20_25535 [Mycobacterium intermedium]OPE46382.1 hypothetical protein BV508_26165 [Mycobacterium intermedium]ORB09430.1 hypothetical protein BST27_05825 [Mycobacterium intermedium]
MTKPNWSDAPEIHPSEIRIGDIIGTLRPSAYRYKVKLIGEPKKTPKQWTFFGSDADGRQHTGTFGENDLVRRYARTS